MMKIGETLEMNVVRIETNDYGSRIILSYGGFDTYRVKAFDFQSEGDIQSTVKVKVIGFDPIKGFPILIQDIEWVLKQTYEHYDLVGRNREFEIIDKKIDNNSNSPFLVLKDDFGLKFHRFYTKNDEYSIGEKIRLHIKELKTNFLSLEIPQERTRIVTGDNLVFTTKDTVAPVTESSTTVEKSTKCGDVVFTETESQNLEYKSSIVYDSNSKVDPDRQIGNILKTVAGFMNADGGTLYIGVCNNGTIRGIESDYDHLNEGDADEYTGQYAKNIDGFELKIRNSVSQYLSSLAGVLFEFSTEKHNGKTVAKILVSKSYAPIYYNGKTIFQRQGNRTIILKDNALTHFCASKWFGSAENFAKIEQHTSDNNPQATRNNTTIDSDNLIRDYNIWHTLHLHENGGWSFDDNAKKDKNGILGNIVCSCDIENFRQKEKHLLLFAYETGNIDALVCDRRQRWLQNRQGWSINGYQKSQGIQSIFCANPMDMVAVFYEQDNKSYVKIVDLSCISIHDNFGNKGNAIVPNDSENCKIFHIHHKYHDMLRGLTRSQRNYQGYDIDNEINRRPIIQKLKEVIKDEYGVIFE